MEEEEITFKAEVCRFVLLHFPCASVCFRVFPWLSFYLGFNHAFRDFRVIPWLR